MWPALGRHRRQHEWRQGRFTGNSYRLGGWRNYARLGGRTNGATGGGGGKATGSTSWADTHAVSVAHAPIARHIGRPIQDVMAPPPGDRQPKHSSSLIGCRDWQTLMRNWIVRTMRIDRRGSWAAEFARLPSVCRRIPLRGRLVNYGTALRAPGIPPWLAARCQAPWQRLRRSRPARPLRDGCPA